MLTSVLLIATMKVIWISLMSAYIIGGSLKLFYFGSEAGCNSVGEEELA